MKREIALSTGLLVALSAMVYAAVIKWSNPDMTVQRLFLTYWWQYILVVACMIAGVVLIKWGMEW